MLKQIHDVEQEENPRKFQETQKAQGRAAAVPQHGV